MDVYRFVTSLVTRILSGGIGDMFFNLRRNCDVSNKYDRVSLTIGVKIFSNKLDSGDKMEPMEATMGLPGGYSVSYGFLVVCKIPGSLDDG